MPDVLTLHSSFTAVLRIKDAKREGIGVLGMRYTEEVERSLLTLVITSAIKTLVGI